MSGFKLQRLGLVMEPEPSNPQEIEGVLNPAAARGPDGKLYLFSYFEYTGDDIAKDAAAMKADPMTRKWWTHTDPCQIRLPDTKEGDWWKGIPEVFHMD